METHGLKHHYHHNRPHQHQTQQPNHTAHSKSQAFGFGSNSSTTLSATIPPTKISSTAFPLLLSSIESGRQNFNSPFSLTKNADGLNNSTSGNPLSSNGNSKLQPFPSLGAASKHKPDSNSTSKNSKNCTNNGVRPTPKPKSVATPNQVSSSGRQQAAFGQSANGHLQAKSSHLTGSEVAAPLSSGLSSASSCLPFKNNLLSRETFNNLSSNGTTHNRRLSPNKENKTATALSNSTAAVLSGTGVKRSTGATTNNASASGSIRSPPTPRSPASSLVGLPSGAGSLAADSVRLGNHHNYNQFNDDHQTLNSVCGFPVSSFYASKDKSSSNNLPTQIAQSNGLSCQSNNLPKPKEFKFFKEKAKDKLKKNLTTSSNLNCDIKVSNKLQQQLKLKSKIKPNSIGSNISVKPTVKKPRKSNPKTSDKSANSLPGKCKPIPAVPVPLTASLSGVDSFDLCLDNRLQPPLTAANSLESRPDISSLQTKPPLHQADQTLLTPIATSINSVAVETSPRIISYKEDIIDNFAFQCFYTAEDLECSLQDARLKHQSLPTSSCPAIGSLATTSTVGTGDPSSATPASVPLNPGSCSWVSVPPSSVPSALILSGNIANPAPSTSTSSAIIAPTIVASPSPRVIFRLRSPSPPSSSSSSSSSSSLESDAESDHPVTKSSHSSHSRKTSSSKSSICAKGKQSNSKRAASPKKNCPKKSAKQKDSGKSKKGTNNSSASSRKKDKSFGSNESLEQIDDEEDEDEEEEERVQTSKHAKRSKKLTMTKCVHKHHKNKDACSKCLLAYKRAKSVIDKMNNHKINQINKNNNRKKGPKGANLAGRKSKCKTKVVNKQQVNKRGRRKKVANRKATKVRKSKRYSNAGLVDAHQNEDEDDEDDELNDEDDDDISDEDELDPPRRTRQLHSDQDENDEDDDDESDATQENGHDDCTSNSSSDLCDSDQDDGDESEDIYEDNRTIADLIKCSNRREAVRKAAARAASMASNARNKLKSNNPACTADLSSQQSNQSGPPTQSDATETADTYSTAGGKKSKLKKLSGKLKLASKLNGNNKSNSSKRKRIVTSNKLSQSDSSSDGDDEQDDESESDAVNDNNEDEDEKDAEPELLITARSAAAAATKRGRRKNNNNKMASVKSKCGKKSKEMASAAAARDNEDDEVGNDGDDDADKDESQDDTPSKGKCQKRNLRSKINNNKKIKRKVTKHESKTAAKTNRKKADAMSEDEEEQEDEVQEDNDDNATDDQADDQHTAAAATLSTSAADHSDSEVDDEPEQSSSDEELNSQVVKKSKAKANNGSNSSNNNNNNTNNSTTNNSNNNKKLVTPKKVAKVAPNRKQKQTPAKTKSQEKNKSDKPKKTTKKPEKTKQETKNCSDSEEETEKSEEDENDSVRDKSDAESDTAGQTQPPPKVHHQQKNKCDKLKAIAVQELNDKSNSDSNKGQVKDVYTFELSPSEVPSTTTRFVLSSGQDSKSRIDCTKNEMNQQEIGLTTAGASTPVTSTSSTAISSSQMSVKSSFSPKGHISNQEYPNGPPVYEPLRPDNYSHYESSFGPNASLSSLSQLSQSIGGGGCGPILLNHQSPNSKCSVNIKEEPKDDSTTVRSPFANQKVTLHRTPPPSAVSDHLSASQNFSANFASAKNGNSHRLWSNASAGSLISSSSSSSSSPVHLAFGQCPPTPATPASLASYFTPSNSLPGFSSSVYQPSQGQDLIRRDLDSRILASAVHDRSLLPPGLSIPSSASTMKPIATVPHFNHVPSSPLINTTSSSSSFITSSTSSPILPQNSAPIYPIIPNMASSGYMTGMNPIIKPIPPLKLGSSPSHNPSPVMTPSVPLSRPPSASSSHSSSSRSKTQLATVKQGSWSSMHVRIAWDIYHKQKAKQQPQQVPSESANRITTPTSSGHHISTTPKASSHKSSKSSSSSSSSSSNSKQVEQSANYLASNSSIQSPSIKNSFDSLNGQTSSLRPASAMSYPTFYPRYGTPFNASSMSAPPVLPGIFPPSMPTSMHMPGFMPESWPRQPFPGSVSASIPPNRSPYLYPEFYDSSNSASSALSAWAASIRPPGDFLMPPKQTTAPSPSAPEPPKHQSSISSGSSSSHKRKHDELESKSKDKTSSHKSHNFHNSTTYQNGDIRSEHSSKRSHSTSSKYSKSDYSHQQTNNSSNNDSNTNSNNIFENGHKNRSRNDQSNVSHVKKTESLKNETKSNFNLSSTSSTITPPSFPGPMFSSHPSFPSHPTSEHQRPYIDLFGIPQSSSSLVSTSPYMDGLNNADLSSRPLWSFGMPPPPPTSASPGMPPSMGHSSMMADPFKSLQDISLRPGLVTPDRDTLFSRYSLLNSSGGGASIFDKLSKEQLEKYEMMQNPVKHSRSSPTVNTSKSSSLSDLSNPSSSSMSTAISNSQSSRLSSLPPTSIPSGVQAPPSSPFPYPQSYLNPLHHLGVPSSSYLAHPPFLNSASNSMLNGGSDAISKMTFGAPLPPGLPTVNDCPPPGSQFLFPPHYPPGTSPGMLNFLKANHHATASANFNSAR